MADTEDDYRSQVEAAERLLVAVLEGAVEDRSTSGGVPDDPHAPLPRLTEAIRGAVKRLQEARAECARLQAELAAVRHGPAVAPPGNGTRAEHSADAEPAAGGAGARVGARESAVEFQVLYELGRSLSAQLSLADVMRETFEGVSRLVDASNFYIGLLNRERNQVDISLNVTESVVDQHITVIGADEGLTGYVLRTGESLLVGEDVVGWLAAHGIEAVGDPAQCWLGVPLIVGDEVQGIMAVQDYRTPHAFTEAHRDVLDAIASQASIAIQNARLFAQIERRARYEQALRELTARVRGATDPDAILRTAVQALGTTLGRRTFVHLGEPDASTRQDARADARGDE
ncbi:MAG: GAF domain-containing protein [Anaerolineae bacterium]|nr:GAF domain-containing protein [Anaerolineae bacterium]